MCTLEASFVSTSALSVPLGQFHSLSLFNLFTFNMHMNSRSFIIVCQTYGVFELCSFSTVAIVTVRCVPANLDSQSEVTFTNAEITKRFPNTEIKHRDRALTVR